MKKQAAAQVTESWGDAAVSGLLAGILAGVVMAAFLAAAGFAGGGTVADVLSHFGTGQDATPIAGLLTIWPCLVSMALAGAIFCASCVV